MLLLLVYAIIFWLEARPLFKQRQWREAVVFCGLFALTLGFSIALVTGVRLPSPLKAVIYLVRDVWGFGFPT